jgi:predicted transcriptional regulator of viral defense system
MNRIDEIVFKTLIPRSPVFRTSDVASLAKVRDDVATRALNNLASHGLLKRVMRGLWAETRNKDFSAYAAVPHLLGEEQGYVSLLSALNLHGMIEQIPGAIHIIIAKQRKPITTSVGRYEFHQLTRDLIGGHEPYGRLGLFELATPAKALFDTLYYSVRKGKRFSRLPELELPRGFRPRDMSTWIKRIQYPSLREAVDERWKVIARRSTHG